MENVINKILQIDKEACQRVEQAKQEKIQILSEAKIEETRIKEEHIKRADDRIDKVDEHEKSLADEKITKIEAEKQQKLAALQTLYDQNHTIWEQDIYRRIVGE